MQRERKYPALFPKTKRKSVEEQNIFGLRDKRAGKEKKSLGYPLSLFLHAFSLSFF
jgi:hypothetical protein